MILFIDASALVAMIAREPEAATFASCLDHSERCYVSAVAI